MYDVKGQHKLVLVLIVEIVRWLKKIVLVEAKLGGPLGIMSPSLNCRHIIATLRFQLNFQGAFFPGRGRVGGGVGVRGVLREPGQGATASISQPDGEGCERSFK